MPPLVGQDEAVALGDVEPLDRAGNLDQIGAIAAFVPGQRVARSPRLAP